MRAYSKKGVSNHINQIFNTWEGIDLKLRRNISEKDPRGRLISIDSTEKDIVGVISEISLNPKLRGAGWISENNSVGFFRGVDYEVGDKIIWEGYGEYEIIQIMGRLFDIEEPVASTVELVMVPRNVQ